MTRDQVEHILIGRRGVLLTLVGLNGTVVGNNPDLNDPIRVAILALSGTVANPLKVVDADIVTIDSTLAPALIDVAELGLVRAIRSHYTRVDIVSGPFQAKFDQLAKRLKEDIADLEQRLQKEYGIGSIVIEMGTVELNFASHNDDIIYGDV